MKRKSKSVSSWYVLLLLSVITYSCMNDGNDDIKSSEPITSNLRINVTKPTDEGGRASEEDIRFAVVSVEKSDGSSVMSLVSLELFDFNGSLITEEIELEVGSYSLTDFFLTDEDGNVLFATPKEGSTYASEVNDPLPIDFEIFEDSVETIVPQVIAVEGDPEDYGYVVFGFQVVETDSLVLNGKLYGLIEDSTGTLSFGSIDYDGESEILANLSGVSGQLNWSAHYNVSKGYYGINYTGGKTNYLVIDSTGQELLNKGTYHFGSNYSKSNDLFYGISYNNANDLFSLSTLDIEGNSGIVATLDSGYHGIGTWATLDNVNSYYMTKLVHDNLSHLLITYDFNTSTFSEIDISNNSLVGSKLFLLEEEELFYGFALNASRTSSQLITMDYDGNEVVVKTLNMVLDQNHITYDKANDLIVGVSGSSICLFDRSGELIKKIIVENTDYEMSTLRAAQ